MLDSTKRVSWAKNYSDHRTYVHHSLYIIPKCLPVFQTEFMRRKERPHPQILQQ